MKRITIDPNFFFKWLVYHFTDHFTLPIGDFHKELMSLLRYDRVAIAAPRGHAKSTYFSFYLSLFAVLEYPGINTLLVSSTGSLAEHWMDKIRVELNMNQSLRAWYGNQEGRKWTTEEIQLQNGSVIMAKGSGKQIRGFRPQLIIGDDLEDDEMVLSVDRRNKFDDWFWNTLIQTLKGGEGKVFVIGTILHPDSFLAEMISHGRRGWVRKLYQAIKKDGSALWPEMYSQEKLDDIKAEMGEYGFSQEYQNDPIPDEKRVFQREWIHYYDELPRDLVFFTTVDPAIEVEKGNDCTAIVTCGVDAEENLYVVDVINKRMLPKETIDCIFEAYEKWGSQKIGIEVVGFQKMLKSTVEYERRIRKQYPIIEELNSSGRRKGLRIESLQPRFQTKKIFLRKGLPQLETQLLRFPSPKCNDDIIDALAYQLDIIKPAKKTANEVDPDCMLAFLERKKRSRVMEGWGNHKLRGREW